MDHDFAPCDHRMQLPSLVAEQHAAIARLCQRTSARKLDLFGSAVHDQQHFDPARSDLDFIVEFDADIPPIAYADAYFSLKEGLESLFGRPVDLVVDRAIQNPYFRRRVDAERQLVYGTCTSWATIVESHTA